MKLSSHRAGHCAGDRGTREIAPGLMDLSEAWKAGHVPQSAKEKTHGEGLGPQPPAFDLTASWRRPQQEEF